MATICFARVKSEAGDQAPNVAKLVYSDFYHRVSGCGCCDLALRRKMCLSVEWEELRVLGDF